MTGQASGPVLVVGAGHRFFSGVSLYTSTLLRALHEAGVPAAAILSRSMCPLRLYPGSARVGSFSIDDLQLPDRVPVLDTLDWWPSAGTLAAWMFAWRARPSALVLQWWSATMLHHYVILAALARLRGARVAIEFHETLDVGEAALPLVSRYARAGMWLLARLAHAGLVHSEADRERVQGELPVGALPLSVALHGPYRVESRDQGASAQGQEVMPGASRQGCASSGAARDPDGAPDDVVSDAEVRLLFFGVVRPYKGLHVLSEALRLTAGRFAVSVVGEPWGDDDASLLEDLSSRGVQVVGRYVSAAELAEHLAAADLVVLPYLRSAASGPLAMVMASGLPAVVSDLPSLREASCGYGGVMFAAPGDPVALAAALDRAAERLVGRRFSDPRSWGDTVRAVLQALDLPFALSSTHPSSVREQAATRDSSEPTAPLPARLQVEQVRA